VDDQGVVDDFNWNRAMYALEKLSESVGILATGEGDARSRILAASRYFLRVTPTCCPQPAICVRVSTELSIS